MPTNKIKQNQPIMPAPVSPTDFLLHLRQRCLFLKYPGLAAIFPGHFKLACQCTLWSLLVPIRPLAHALLFWRLSPSFSTDTHLFMSHFKYLVLMRNPPEALPTPASLLGPEFSVSSSDN